MNRGTRSRAPSTEKSVWALWRCYDLRGSICGCGGTSTLPSPGSFAGIRAACVSSSSCTGQCSLPRSRRSYARSWSTRSSCGSAPWRPSRISSWYVEREREREPISTHRWRVSPLHKEVLCTNSLPLSLSLSLGLWEACTILFYSLSLSLSLFSPELANELLGALWAPRAHSHYAKT